jgi:hypothetical protein
MLRTIQSPISHLFVADRARRIDLYIDYFGERRDPSRDPVVTRPDGASTAPPFRD